MMILHVESYGMNRQLHQHTSRDPIPAAINSRHSLSVKEVDFPRKKPYIPETIEVKGSAPQFVIKFNSASSKVNVFHEHQPENVPSIKESYSEDEPQILRHSVSKPIVQEIYEIISPYRRVVQEIKPVEETIQTIISRSNDGNGDRQYRSNTSSKSSLKRPESTDTVIRTNSEEANSSRKEEDEPNHQMNTNSIDPNNQPEPDLVLDDSNFFDNSIYNGNAELDLKYPSSNELNTKYDHKNRMVPLLYNEIHQTRLYRDR